MLENLNDKKVGRQISRHILPTSANLLGICFLIFSLSHINGRSESTVLDEAAAIAIVIFLFAALFAYLSLRSEKMGKLEVVADVCFMIGLFLLAACSVGLAVNFVH